MKRFFQGLKGWKKLLFWVIVIILLVNLFQLNAYIHGKSIWYFNSKSEEIPLIFSISFTLTCPSPGNILRVERFSPVYQAFLKNQVEIWEIYNYKTFEEYWNSAKHSAWFTRTTRGLGFLVIKIIVTLLDWLYCIFVVFFWGILIKGFLWGVLLSGSWMK